MTRSDIFIEGMSLATHPASINLYFGVGLESFITLRVFISAVNGMVAQKSNSMDTISLIIQIPPQEIAYLSFIIESYEGVAVVRTIDPRAGLVELMVSPHFQVEMDAILLDLAREFPVQNVSPTVTN